MTKKEFFNSIEDDLIKRTYKQLFLNLSTEYGITFKDLVTRDKDEIIKLYTATGELGKYRKDNNEINILEKSIPLFRKDPSKLTDFDASVARKTLDDFPPRQGKGFYKDGLAVLKRRYPEAYDDINLRSAEIIRAEKAKDAPLSKVGKAFKSLAEFSYNILIYEVGKESVKNALNGGKFIGFQSLTQGLATLGLLTIPYIVKRAVDNSAAHQRVIREKLTDSVTFAINLKNSEEPEKHLYLKAKASSDLRNAMFSISDQRKSRIDRLTTLER